MLYLNLKYKLMIVPIIIRLKYLKLLIIGIMNTLLLLSEGKTTSTEPFKQTYQL